MRIRTVVAGVLLSVLVGCQTPSITERPLLSVEQIKTLSATAYHNRITEAASQQLLNTDDATLIRLRRIAATLTDETHAFSVDALQWHWEISLIQSDVMNAFCLPGGKVLFYSAIIERLKLTDDEIAALMSHEMAHALKAHDREAMSDAYAVEMDREAVDVLQDSKGKAVGLADNVVWYALTLPYRRENEVEADLIGLELMARGGYHPQAALSVWQKMAQNTGDPSSEFMRIHPARERRMADFRRYTLEVMPLYYKAINYYP